MTFVHKHKTPPVIKWMLTTSILLGIAIFIYTFNLLTNKEISPNDESDSLIRKKQLIDVKFFSTIPTKIILNRKKLSLGKRIFNSNALSKTGKMSCQSCHQIKYFGTDKKQFSFDYNNKALKINTPTIYNLSSQLMFTHDGSVDNLTNLFKKEINHFQLQGENISNITLKIKDIPSLKKLYHKIYGNNVIESNIIDALVYYLKSLKSPNSKFDRFLTGEVELFDQNELNGFMKFKKIGCVNCHHGENIGSNILQKRSVFGVHLLNNNILGLYNKTNLKFDKFLVKVPTLRNIEFTSPYLYDGSIKTLDDTVKAMYTRQLNKRYDQKDVDAIITFLKTLTSPSHQGGIK